jgi:hypothetical protein
MEDGKIKKVAKYMIESMTKEEKDFILLINLCSHLEEDEELFKENWKLMRAEQKNQQDKIPMEEIFPAVYERLGKKP